LFYFFRITQNGVIYFIQVAAIYYYGLPHQPFTASCGHLS
jgi:hypothetical protein